MVSSVLPIPINRGSAHRTDQVIKSFLDLGVSVDLVLLNQSESETTSKEIIRRTLSHYGGLDLSVYCYRHPRMNIEKYRNKKNWQNFLFRSLYFGKRKLNKVFGRHYSITNSDHLPHSFRRKICKHLQSKNYDLAWFNYAKILAPEFVKDTKCIVDMHDLQYERVIDDFVKNFTPWLANILTERFKYSEINQLKLADLAVSISSRETKALRSISNGVINVKTIAATDDRILLPEKERTFDLLFCGSRSDQNVRGLIWFLDNVWPILGQHGMFRLGVVGRVCGHKDVQNAVSRCSYREQIDLVGFVHSLPEVYAKSTVSVSPIVDGSGAKIKIVEALACGLPIIATTKALEGIEHDGLLEPVDEPVDFADACLRALSDDANLNALRNVSKKVFEKHDRQIMINRLDSILRDELWGAQK